MRRVAPVVGIVALVLLMVGLVWVIAGGSTPGRIVGFVVDAGGDPVPAAIVRVQATDVAVTTAQDGSFVLPAPDSPVGVSAWAPGFYIGGGEPAERGDRIEIVLRPLPASDNEAYDWLSVDAGGEGEAQGCIACHSSAGSSLGHALPVDEWRLDAHGRSAQNERFLTMFFGTDVAGNQSPPTRYVINRDYGRVPLRPAEAEPYFGPGYRLDFPDGSGNCGSCHLPVAAADDPHGADPAELAGVELEGIACDFCHKISDVIVDPVTGLPDAGRPGVMSIELLRPGEGHQVFFGPLDDVSPGDDAYSALQTESRFCAACHFGSFWGTVVYDSFGEWLRSDFSDPVTGKTCQDCHMPPTGNDVFVLPDQGGRQRDPALVRNHLMPGAADEALLQDALTMSVVAGLSNTTIEVEVSIVNDRTGHHVPTDSPLRHVILVVTARDDTGADLTLIEGPVLPEWTGSGDPSDGRFAGRPGTVYAKVLEELWTEVSPTGAYWNPTRVVSDNRIPARGASVTRYLFASSDGEATVEAVLLFRRAFVDLMDQKGWDVPDIVMARQTVDVPVPVP